MALEWDAVNEPSRPAHPRDGAGRDRRRRRLGGGRGLESRPRRRRVLRHRRRRGLSRRRARRRAGRDDFLRQLRRPIRFLGFYIVRPDLRGRGYGLRIWNAAVEHAGDRTIGLDGVVAQQDNYRKSGFRLAYPMSVTAGRVAAGAVPAGDHRAGGSAVRARGSGRRHGFPAPRTAFLRAWIDTPGHVGRALVRDGRLVAWGVIRPCRTGCKIGPLVADDRAAAEAVFAALAAAAGGGEIFLDVPQRQPRCGRARGDHGLSPAFETARMYTGRSSASPRTRVRRHHVRTG